MTLPAKTTKENFRLLDISTDEESEDLNLEIIPSRKRKFTRRDKKKNVMVQSPPSNVGSEVRGAVKWAIRGTLLLWLMMLTWICATLYDQVSLMRADIMRVSTSSDGVGDALQRCHTAEKELRANSTALAERLAALELAHAELARRVQRAGAELAAVTEQLAAAPKLADTPRRLAELQRTVADFGSQINGFDGALSSTRKQAVSATTGLEEVRKLIQALEGRTNDTIVNITATAKREEDLNSQLSALNTTIFGQIDALQTKIEQVNKTAVTTSTPASVATSTTSTTTSTSTTTKAPTTPEQRTKPVVTQ